MKNDSVKKRLLIISSVFVSLLLIFLLTNLLIYICSRVPQKQYTIPYSYDNDFVAVIKVPENTVYEGESGDSIMNFSTTLSKTEVTNFYDEYFSSLKKVYPKQTLNQESSSYYYDCEQKTVLSDISATTKNDKTYFSISCSKCENIKNDEYFTNEK